MTQVWDNYQLNVLLVLVLAVGLVIALIRLQGKWRIYLLIALIGGAGAVGGIGLLRNRQLVQTARLLEVEKRKEAILEKERALSGGRGGAIWDRAVDLNFPADSYPDIESAAKGGVLALLGRLDEIKVDKASSLKRVYLLTKIPDLPSSNIQSDLPAVDGELAWAAVNPSVLNSIADTLRQRYPDADISVHSVYTQDDPIMQEAADEQTLSISFTIDVIKTKVPLTVQLLDHCPIQLVHPAPRAPEAGESPAGQSNDPWDEMNRTGGQIQRVQRITQAVKELDRTGLSVPLEGRLGLDVVGVHGGLHHQVLFYNKRWINHFNELANRLEPSVIWYAARSQDALANIAGGAHEQALAAAKSWLKGKLRQEGVFERGSHPLGFMTERPQTVPEPTESQMRQWGILADSYVQQLVGRVGAFSRESILLRLGPEELARVREAYGETTAEQRAALLKLLLRAAGLLVLVFVLYLLLDYATKGYYRLVLKLLAGVVLAAALIFLLTLA